MSRKYDTPTDLLRELSLSFGPSGCEGNVADIIIDYVTPYADEIIRDKLGSVIAVYKRRLSPEEYDIEAEPRAILGKPDTERLMLCAHMDEVGFMINSIDSDGYLKIAALSGKDPRVLKGRGVTVGDEERKTIGYFGVKPVHLGGSGDFSSLYIDIGAKDKEEAEKYVQIGDFGTYRSDFVRFGSGGHKLKGKALDDRLGCTVLCTVLKNLSEKGAVLPFDVYFTFTCREEIGSSTAHTAANLVDPDTAFILEATAVNDILGEEYGAVAKQGEGPCISFMDRATIHDKELYDFVFETAKAHSVPVQSKNYVAGGTDAGPIQRSLDGVKCLGISAPARYIHTASNVIDERDMYSMIDLTEAIIDELAKE
ncbi:MAG: M42 family metallopeptidase [Ruminococcaceae bacterium]|nr:M42 family metallopeptidase [Oscillospiraceae bacterium]